MTVANLPIQLRDRLLPGEMGAVDLSSSHPLGDYDAPEISLRFCWPTMRMFTNMEVSFLMWISHNACCIKWKITSKYGWWLGVPLFQETSIQWRTLAVKLAPKKSDSVENISNFGDTGVYAEDTAVRFALNTKIVAHDLVASYIAWLTCGYLMLSSDWLCHSTP